MKCSQCASDDTKVIESRDVTESQAIRRRRSCNNCGHRFTTYERVEHPQIVVIKNNGTRELFSRDKLLAGLYRACEKTTITNVQIEQLVSEIEKHLQQCADSEVSTSKIGDLVMEGLSGLNEVAYVRFASVYRRFTDIAGFEQELSQIKNKKTEKTKV